MKNQNSEQTRIFDEYLCTVILPTHSPVWGINGSIKNVIVIADDFNSGIAKKIATVKQ